MQEQKNKKIRLKGLEIKIWKIDSHNFIVSKKCTENIKWDIEKYDADGIFASECYKVAQTKKYIEKVLSTYNALRQE